MYLWFILSPDGWVVSVRMYINLFIFVDGCFLANANIAAIDICVQVFMWTCAFISFWKIPGSCVVHCVHTECFSTGSPAPRPHTHLLKIRLLSRRWAEGRLAKPHLCLTCIYSHCPPLRLMPELGPGSGQWWHQILIATRTWLWLSMRGSRLRAPLNRPETTHSSTAVPWQNCHRISPWAQKG